MVYIDELNLQSMDIQERYTAIFECHKRGLSQTVIGEIFNRSQSTVSKAISLVKAGLNIAKEETRGAKSKLSASQKEELKELLQHPPSDYGHTVWDKWSIKDLLAKQFEVVYHENHIFRIMKYINFSSQKPQQKDYRQDPEKVIEFKSEKAPELKEKAAMEQRRIVFQDEAAVHLVPSIRKIYAPKGQTPELLTDTKNKDYVGISGVVSPDGYFYFEVREQEGFKQKGLTNFLDNTMADCLDRLLVVWDNASSHQSKTVKNHVKTQGSLPLIWLENTPPYSPELNPIEQLWANLKHRLANQFFKNTKQLKAAVTDILQQIKNDKDLIISFFKHKEIDCYQFF